MNNVEYLSGPQNPNEMDPDINGQFYEYEENPGRSYFLGIKPIVVGHETLDIVAARDWGELSDASAEAIDQAFTELPLESPPAQPNESYIIKDSGASMSEILDIVRAATKRPSDEPSSKKPPLVGERYGVKFYRDQIIADLKSEALDRTKSLVGDLDNPQDPAQLDLTDPHVIAANTSFDAWVNTMQDYNEPENHDQRAKNTLEITRFYVDAGFTGKGYLDVTLPIY